MFHTRLEALAAQYQSWLETTAVFLFVLGVAYGVGRYLLLPPLVRGVRARNPDNPTLVDAVRTYTKVLIFVAALPLATAAAGFGRFVAGSSVILAAATLAVGVAGREVIGNLVSGAFLVADREFNVGDRVAWDGYEGTVERVELRVTRIRTPAGEVLTVPNTELTTHPLREPYAGERYRVGEPLAVSYEADLAEVARMLEEAALAEDRVVEEPGPSVVVRELGDDAVRLEARFWVRRPSEANVAGIRSRYLARAKEQLREAGIEVAPASQRELSGSLDVGGDGRPG